jgi:formylglycine-generating enzyme required for sulfatase activity
MMAAAPNREPSSTPGNASGRATGSARQPRSNITHQVSPPAPRWRDAVLPVLYPPVAPPRTWRRQAARSAFWLALNTVLALGVLLPWLRPGWVAALHVAVAPTATAPAPAASAPAAAPAYAAGARLRDCNEERLCPWLRVLPVGQFQMGSLESEEGHIANESPHHQVRIANAFAVMETEVTRGQFAAFIKESGYRAAGGCFTRTGDNFKDDPKASWRAPGFEQNDDHPVVCVSWVDATAYADWLSKKIGQPGGYRLLTEAEWEYAARAGTNTRYNFGDRAEDLCANANVADRSAKAQAQFKGWTIAECTDGYVYTAPARTFKPNAFGLFDMHGNAWEWTQDCWHDDYKNAPKDGVSWQDGCNGTNEDRRVLRGGGWSDIPQNSRSAVRFRDAPGIRDNDSGFRLARTLTPSTLTPLPTTPARAK